MEVFLLVLISLLQVGSVSSLQCYQCSSTNEASCLSKQSVMSCSGNKQGACMTVSYITMKDGDYITKFRKGCWKCDAHCKSFCSLSAFADAKSCEVNCCTTDGCNAHGLKKPEIYQDKNKRSTNMNNADRKTRDYSGLLITSLIFIAYCILNS